MTTEPVRIDALERMQRRVDRERRAREQAESISEQSTRELYARQQELALLVAVARAANDSTDVEAALQRSIACVCAYTGWPVGHVFLVDPAVGLRPTAIWHLAHPERFETFRRITEATTLAPGQSLGGRVLVSARPDWVADLMADDDFAQKDVSRDLGVRAGFAFPILVGTEVVGVMEFFHEEVTRPDERLLDLMGQIGTELGRAIERDRARVEQRRLHDELAARAAELERSNAELQQFASIASHDLQEPLRKVRAFNQRVVESEAERLSEQGRDYLQRANSAAGRMQTLINDLLAFSRVSTRGRPFTAVDLTRLTAIVLDDLETAIDRAEATVSVGPLPTIEADETQMRQLLQNLLANALKFHRADVATEVSVAAEVDDGVARITVRDNGIGFEPSHSDRIFRVFERLHGRSEYDGTGIGLALCRKIAERHGGTVSGDGTPGVGATFTVTIPTTHDATAQDRPLLAAGSVGGPPVADA